MGGVTTVTVETLLKCSGGREVVVYLGSSLENILQVIRSLAALTHSFNNSLENDAFNHVFTSILKCEA